MLTPDNGGVHIVAHETGIDLFGEGASTGGMSNVRDNLIFLSDEDMDKLKRGIVVKSNPSVKINGNMIFSVAGGSSTALANGISWIGVDVISGADAVEVTGNTFFRIPRPMRIVTGATKIFVEANVTVDSGDLVAIPPIDGADNVASLYCGANYGNRASLWPTKLRGNTLQTYGNRLTFLYGGGATAFSATSTASPVNYHDFINAPTGLAPRLRAIGSDVNIDLRYTPKGTGANRFTGGVTPDVNGAGSLGSASRAWEGLYLIDQGSILWSGGAVLAAIGTVLKTNAQLVFSAASPAPEIGTNGQMTFELTDDTTLTIKARGSDGVTRSAAVTLA